MKKKINVKNIYRIFNNKISDLPKCISNLRKLEYL